APLFGTARFGPRAGAALGGRAPRWARRAAPARDHGWSRSAARIVAADPPITPESAWTHRVVDRSLPGVRVSAPETGGRRRDRRTTARARPASDSTESSSPAVGPEVGPWIAAGERGRRWLRPQWPQP